MLFSDILRMLILEACFKSSDSVEKLQDPSLRMKVDRMDQIAGSHEGFRTAFKTAQAWVLSGADFGAAAYLIKHANEAIQDIETKEASLVVVRTSLPNEPQCPAVFLSWNFPQIPDEADVQTCLPNRRHLGRCPPVGRTGPPNRRMKRAFRQRSTTFLLRQRPQWSTTFLLRKRPRLLSLGGSRLSPSSSARAWRGSPTG